MVLLRDGRTLIGFLRSVDQFANLVLHRTIERIHVGNEYGDIPRGIFIIRGENVVLLGEIVRKLERFLENKLLIKLFLSGPGQGIQLTAEGDLCGRHPGRTTTGTGATA